MTSIMSTSESEEASSAGESTEKESKSPTKAPKLVSNKSNIRKTARKLFTEPMVAGPSNVLKVKKPESLTNTATQRPSRPPYAVLVIEAVKELDENNRNGVSIQKIVNFISSKYDLTEASVRLHCKRAIVKNLELDIFQRKTGVGNSGSFKLSNNYKKKQKKSTAKKSAPVKAVKKAVPVAQAKVNKKVPTQTSATVKQAAAKRPAKKAETSTSTKTAVKSVPKNKVVKSEAPTKAKVSKQSGRVSLSVGIKSNPKLAKPAAKKPTTKATAVTKERKKTK